MAVLANTIETYDNSVQYEDLQNEFAMISPEATPFQNMLGTRDVTSNQFDWPIVELASPDSSNRVKEGEDAPDVDAGTLADRIWNFTQISDKVASVSHTSQATVSAADNIQRMANQKALKMKELRRDLEVMLLSNTVAATGTAQGAAVRVSAGFPTFLKTNAAAAAGATAPTLSATSEGYPDAAWGDGTATRVFAEDDLNDAIAKGWDSGAEPSVIMLNGGNKRRLSKTFTGSSTRYKDASERTLSASIDFYESDFGDLSVVPNRFQPTLNAAGDDDNYAVYIIDPEYVTCAWLEPVQSKPLAETGHSFKELIWCEYGLQVDNEAAHAIITDTDNTVG